MNYCINVPFIWDQESLDWIDLKLQYYVDEFYDKFPDNGGFFLRKMDKRSSEFQTYSPMKHIKKFLNSIEITNFYTHLLIYKEIPDRIEPRIENPHIDTPDSIPLPARFNVLIRGDKEGSMHWWNKDINSEIMIQVPYRDGFRYQIKGRNNIEQLQILGESDFCEKNLSQINKTASFIKTDIAHSICRAGKERILLSTEIRHNWDYIVDKISKYKEKLNVL